MSSLCRLMNYFDSERVGKLFFLPFVAATRKTLLNSNLMVWRYEENRGRDKNSN